MYLLFDAQTYFMYVITHVCMHFLFIISTYSLYILVSRCPTFFWELSCLVSMSMSYPCLVSVSMLLIGYLPLLFDWDLVSFRHSRLSSPFNNYVLDRFLFPGGRKFSQINSNLLMWNSSQINSCNLCGINWHQSWYIGIIYGLLCHFFWLGSSLYRWVFFIIWTLVWSSKVS